MLESGSWGHSVLQTPALVSFVTKQKWVYKKKMYMFHFVTFCYVTSIFQIFWSVSSCFRVFLYMYILYVSFVTKQK